MGCDKANWIQFAQAIHQVQDNLVGALEKLFHNCNGLGMVLKHVLCDGDIHRFWCYLQSQGDKCIE